MAARRLLIVMLVLLGVSTLAAALLPNRTLRSDKTETTTTQQTTSTKATSAQVPPTRFSRTFTVGGNQIPIVTCPHHSRDCNPIRVGDRVSFRVLSRKPAELAIPEFGQIGYATPNSPALFELLADQRGTFGIVFTEDHRVAARFKVEPAKGG